MLSSTQWRWLAPFVTVVLTRLPDRRLFRLGTILLRLPLVIHRPSPALRSAAFPASLRSGHADAAIGSEQAIPVKIDHRKITVGMAVVDKMKLLLAPEPGKAAKPRF